MSLRQQFINESFKFVALLENSGDFIFSQVGLTVKTYSILYLISTGLDTSKDLLNGTYGSKPNMAKKLKFLEDNNFIERSIDSSDKRVFRFSLTSKAKKTLEKLAPIYENSILEIFQGVKDSDLKKAYEVLQKCLDNINSCNR